MFDFLVKVNTAIVGFAALAAVLSAPFILTDHTELSFGQKPAEAYVEEGVVAGISDEIQPTQTPTPTPTPPIIVSKPVRIEIPSLQIDANVENVGVTEENVMEIPTDFDAVGWFDQSLRPGQAGQYAAIMSGHYDRTNGSAAVFFNLEELSAGDEIRVTDEQGITYVFTAQDQFSHPLEEFPADIVYGEVERPSLKLITCDGVWHSGAGSYSDRLVVTAVLSQIVLPSETSQ